MKKLWVALMIVMLGMTGGITNVEAKRLGGGGSFGKSSPSPAKPAPMQNAGQQAPRPAAPAAPAPDLPLDKPSPDTAAPASLASALPFPFFMSARGFGFAAASKDAPAFLRPKV